MSSVIQVKLELKLSATDASLALSDLGQMFFCFHVFYQGQNAVTCVPASEIKYVRGWRQIAFFFPSSRLELCMFFSQMYVKARQLHVWHQWGVVVMRGLCWGMGPIFWENPWCHFTHWIQSVRDLFWLWSPLFPPSLFLLPL